MAASNDHEPWKVFGTTALMLVCVWLYAIPDFQLEPQRLLGEKVLRFLAAGIVTSGAIWGVSLWSARAAGRNAAESPLYATVARIARYLTLALCLLGLAVASGMGAMELDWHTCAQAPAPKCLDRRADYLLLLDSNGSDQDSARLAAFRYRTSQPPKPPGDDTIEGVVRELAHAGETGKINQLIDATASNATLQQQLRLTAGAELSAQRATLDAGVAYLNSVATVEAVVSYAKAIDTMRYWQRWDLVELFLARLDPDTLRALTRCGNCTSDDNNSAIEEDDLQIRSFTPGRSCQIFTSAEWRLITPFTRAIDRLIRTEVALGQFDRALRTIQAAMGVDSFSFASGLLSAYYSTPTDQRIPLFGQYASVLADSFNQASGDQRWELVIQALPFAIDENDETLRRRMVHFVMADSDPPHFSVRIIRLAAHLSQYGHQSLAKRLSQRVRGSTAAMIAGGCIGVASGRGGFLKDAIADIQELEQRRQQLWAGAVLEWAERALQGEDNADRDKDSTISPRLSSMLKLCNAASDRSVRTGGLLEKSDGSLVACDELAKTGEEAIASERKGNDREATEKLQEILTILTDVDDHKGFWRRPICRALESAAEQDDAEQLNAVCDSTGTHTERRNLAARTTRCLVTPGDTRNATCSDEDLAAILNTTGLYPVGSDRKSQYWFAGNVCALYSKRQKLPLLVETVGNNGHYGLSFEWEHFLDDCAGPLTDAGYASWLVGFVSKLNRWEAAGVYANIALNMLHSKP